MLIFVNHFLKIHLLHRILDERILYIHCNGLFTGKPILEGVELTEGHSHPLKNEKRVLLRPKFT